MAIGNNIGSFVEGVIQGRSLKQKWADDKWQREQDKILSERAAEEHQWQREDRAVAAEDRELQRRRQSEDDTYTKWLRDQQRIQVAREEGDREALARAYEDAKASQKKEAEAAKRAEGRRASGLGITNPQRDAYVVPGSSLTRPAPQAGIQEPARPAQGPTAPKSIQRAAGVKTPQAPAPLSDAGVRAPVAPGAATIPPRADSPAYAGGTDTKSGGSSRGDRWFFFSRGIRPPKTRAEREELRSAIEAREAAAGSRTQQGSVPGELGVRPRGVIGEAAVPPRADSPAYSGGAPAPAAATGAHPPAPGVNRTPPQAAQAAPVKAPVPSAAPGATGVVTPSVEAAAATMGPIRSDPRATAPGVSRKKDETARVKSFMDHYLQVAAPQVVEHYLSTGQVDKASAFEKWAQDETVKKGMAEWARGVHAATVGDEEGFLDSIVSSYNSNGYFDDGYSIEKNKSGFIHDGKGGITGAEIVFKNDQTGELTTRRFEDIGDIYEMGIMFLSPEAVFEYGMKQITAAQTAQADAAQGELEHQRRLEIEAAKKDTADPLKAAIDYLAENDPTFSQLSPQEQVQKAMEMIEAQEAGRASMVQRSAIRQGLQSGPLFQ